MISQNSPAIKCQRREKSFLQLISRITKPFSFQMSGGQMRQYSLKNMISCGVNDYFYCNDLLPSKQTCYDAKSLIYGVITEFEGEEYEGSALCNVHPTVYPSLSWMCTHFPLEGCHLIIDDKRVELDDDSFINSSVLLGMFLLHVLTLSENKSHIINLFSNECKRILNGKGQLRASLVIAPVEDVALKLVYNEKSSELRNYYQYDFIFSARGLKISSSGSRTKFFVNETAQQMYADFDGEVVEWY